MQKMARSKSIAYAAVTAILMGMASTSAPAFARDQNHHNRSDRHDDRRTSGSSSERHWRGPIDRGNRTVVVRPDHVRHYRNVIISRPYGHWYHGYGHYYDDDSAFKWLAFATITFVLLNSLSEAQQRAHEDAQIRATSSPIGEPIIWRDGDAQGSVTPVREGNTTSGRYCREFQQVVTISGKSEKAYGTACQQPDGSWEIVSVD